MHKIIRFFLTFFLYLAIAHTVWISFVADNGGLNADSRNSMPQLLSGEAHRPFAFRILVPKAVNVLSTALETPLQLYKKYYWENQLLIELKTANLAPEYMNQWIIFSFITIGCLILFGYSLSYLLRHFYQIDNMSSVLWSLVALALLPIFFGPVNYMYDPLSLLIPILMFICLLNQQLIPYYLLFIVAVLNKETAILLMVYFIVIYGQRKSISQTSFHVILQLMIYLGLQALIHHHVRGNPGGIVEYNFNYNMAFLATPSLHLLGTILIVAIFLFLICSDWASKPKELRHSLISMSVFLIPLWFLFGRISEIRLFYECYFLICLLAYPTAVFYLSRDTKA